MQHEIGAIVEGKVTGITKFGAFVELDGGAVGMVHISEVSSTYVNDISEHLKEQQKVTVKVLNITDEGKISLSIKKAMPQETSMPRREYKPNNSNSKSSPLRTNNNARNNNPRNSNGGGYKPAIPSKPATFDDMLSKFLQSSEEKTSDMKREKSSRRGGPKRSRDYD